MSSLKCPRCKSLIKKGATFCDVCGSPVESEKPSVKIVSEENIVEQVKEEKPIKNNCKIIIFALIIVLILFIISFSLMIYFMNDRSSTIPKCEENIKYVEKEPSFQYINFNGYIFKMPIDWNFINNSSDYLFINKAEDIFVQIEYSKDLEFETFISDEYQKEYLELLKSDENIFINNRVLKTKNDINYYSMEGTYDNYNYMIVVVPNVEGIFTIKAEFKDNNAYNNKKSEIIEFALSFNQK